MGTPLAESSLLFGCGDLDLLYSVGDGEVSPIPGKDGPLMLMLIECRDAILRVKEEINREGCVCCSMGTGYEESLDPILDRLTDKALAQEEKKHREDLAKVWGEGYQSRWRQESGVNVLDPMPINPYVDLDDLPLDPRDREVLE